MASTLGTLTLDLVARVSEFNRNMQSATRTVETASSQMSRAAASASNTIRYLLAMSGTYISMAGLVAAADQYTELSNRLKLVTNSQIQLNTALEDTFKISQATRQDWQQTTQIYQRFMQMSEQLGLSQAKVASIVETVGKAVAISGSSAQSAQAALMQLGQAIGSGVLRGEEFNSVAEQASGLLQAIAKGLNVNTSELRKMANDGKLTGQMLVTALTNAKDSVDALFETSSPTIGQSFVVFTNSLRKFVGEASTANGVSSKFAETVVYLGENLDKLAAIGGAAAIGYFTKAVATGTIAMATFVKTTFAKIAADRAAAVQTEQALALEVRRAFAAHNAATAQMSAARAATLAAEAKVLADRQVIASEVGRLNSTLAQYRAEMQLEATRLRNQINDTGRMMTATRMAQLRQAEALVVAELAAAETLLARTVVGSAPAVVAARTAQSAATAQLTVATSALNVAQNAATASATRMTWASGLLKAVLSPMSIAITAATLALFYFTSGSDEATKSVASQTDAVKDLAAAYDKMSLAKALAEISKLKEESQKATSDMKKAAIDAKSVVQDGFFRSNSDIMLWNEITSGLGTFDELTKKVITTTAVIEKLKATGRFSESDIANVSKYYSNYEDAKVKVENFALAQTYLKDRAAIATNASEDQAEAVKILSSNIRVANDELDRSNAALDEQIKWLTQTAYFNKASAESQDLVTKAVKEYREGTITAAQLAAVFGKNLEVPAASLDSFVKLANKTDAASRASVVANNALKILNSTQDAAVKSSNAHAAAKEREAAATKRAQEAYKSYSEELTKDLKAAAAENSLLGSGQSPNRQKEILRFLKESNYNKDFQNSKAGQAALTKALAVADLNDQIEAKRKAASEAATKSSKEEESAAKKAAKVSADAHENRMEMFKDLKDSYRNDSQVAEDNYAKNIALINEFTKGNLKLKNDMMMQEGLLRAEAIAKDEVAYSEMLAGYIAFAKTEEQLVSQHYDNLEKLAKTNSKLSPEQKTAATNAIAIERDMAIEAIQRKNALEILEAKKSQMTQLAYISERYRIEREDIAANLSKSKEYRDTMLEASKLAQMEEKNKLRNDALNTYRSAFNLGEDYDVQNQYDAELVAQGELLNSLQINYEEYLKAKAAITKRYADAESSLRLSQAGEIVGSMASMFKDMQGEQSTAYRVMFAAQKGFAIAQSVMAIQAAMASSAMSLPFPANLAAMATVAAEMASIVSNISSVRPQGFANGGYTGAGGKYDPAGIVHKGEVVWSQADIKRAGGVANVEALRKGDNASTGGNVYINNYGNDTVSTERNSNGDLIVTIQKQIDSYVPAQLAKPNSSISRALSQNTQTQRRR